MQFASKHFLSRIFIIFLFSKCILCCCCCSTYSLSTLSLRLYRSYLRTWAVVSKVQQQQQSVFFVRAGKREREREIGLVVYVVHVYYLRLTHWSQKAPTWTILYVPYNHCVAQFHPPLVRTYCFYLLFVQTKYDYEHILIVSNLLFVNKGDSTDIGKRPYIYFNACGTKQSFRYVLIHSWQN